MSKLPATYTHPSELKPLQGRKVRGAYYDQYLFALKQANSAKIRAFAAYAQNNDAEGDKWAKTAEFYIGQAHKFTF